MEYNAVYSVEYVTDVSEEPVTSGFRVEKLATQRVSRNRHSLLPYSCLPVALLNLAP
jgi:hypothetical protein